MRTFDQIMYVLGIASTLILVLQLVIAVFGLSENEGGDGSAVKPAADKSQWLQVFNVQGIVAFLFAFSWSGAGLSSTGMPEWLAAAIAFLVGSSALLAVAKIFQIRNKLF